MIYQGSFWTWGMVRNTDPDTSRDAAQSIKKKKTRDMLAALAYSRAMLLHGMSDFTRIEFRAWLVCDQRLSIDRAESLRRRLSDLVKRGDLVDTGARRGGSIVLKLKDL